MRTSRPRNNFNPRSHEGSDLYRCTAGMARKISIHAPTRGATQHPACGCHNSFISIHAPTRGATCILRQVCGWNGFQSTLPRGERRALYPRPASLPHFNPRSHEGSDQSTSIISPLPLDFNPRSHEGSDRMYQVSSKYQHHFNPRSHEGSDEEMASHLLHRQEFQSTLPRGERRSLTTLHRKIQIISIHAPTRGATRSILDRASQNSFQSTLPRGERPQFYLKFTLCF